eukprot:3572619-Heterocapsa_arctica.AAC.1
MPLDQRQHGLSRGELHTGGGMEQSSLLAAGASVVWARAGRTGEEGVAVVDGCAGGLADAAAF